MASFDRDPASGRYHIRFRFGGKPFKRSLPLADDREAERAYRQKKADTSRTFTSRQVPIHPALAEVMRAWFADHPGGPAAICTANGKPIGPRMGTQYFTAAPAGSRWAVIPGFHCFRHSMASIMARRGIDQRTINDVLGHSTEDMVRRYHHLFPAKKGEWCTRCSVEAPGPMREIGRLSRRRTATSPRISLWAGKAHEALLGTYAVLALWLLGPWMISSACAPLGVPSWMPPRASDPFRLSFANSFVPGSVGWADDLAFLGVTWTISAGLAALAVARLRAVCAKERGRKARARLEWNRPAWLARLGTLADVLPGPSLDANPVLWREWHRNRPSAWARSVATLFLALAAAFSIMAAVAGSSTMRMLVNAFQVSIGLLLLSVTAATSLAEERTRGSLDVLMTTTLTTREIVLGKWLGAFRPVPVLALLPAWVVLAEAGRGFERWSSAFLMALYVVAVGAAITGLGLAMATWCGRLGRAIGLTVAAYVVVTVGWMFLVMAMTGPQPYGIPLITASPFYGPIVITRLHGRTNAEPGGLAAVVFWIVAYAAASFALLASTLKTFDRCLGRAGPGTGLAGSTPRRAIEVGDGPVDRPVDAGSGRSGLIQAPASLAVSWPPICGGMSNSTRMVAGPDRVETR